LHGTERQGRQRIGATAPLARTRSRWPLNSRGVAKCDAGAGDGRTTPAAGTASQTPRCRGAVSTKANLGGFMRIASRITARCTKRYGTRSYALSSAGNNRFGTRSALSSRNCQTPVTSVAVFAARTTEVYCHMPSVTQRLDLHAEDPIDCPALGRNQTGTSQLIALPAPRLGAADMSIGWPGKQSGNEAGSSS